MDKLLELFEYYGTYYAGEKERSSDGLKERGRVERGDERTSDVLPQKRAGVGGGEVEIARERSSGASET